MISFIKMYINICFHSPVHLVPHFGSIISFQSSRYLKLPRDSPYSMVKPSVDMPSELEYQPAHFQWLSSSFFKESLIKVI